MGRKKNFIEEEILDKAIVLFQQKGYNATSPEELVKYLGISRSSLYATFGDKRGLLIKSLQYYVKLTADSVNKVTENNNDPIRGIEEIFNIAIEGCYHPGMPNGCFLVNSIIEFGSEDTQALELIRQSYQNCLDALSHFLILIKKDNPESKNLDIETTVDYLMNTISGIVVSTKAGMDEKSCRKMVDKTLSILK